MEYRIERKRFSDIEIEQERINNVPRKERKYKEAYIINQGKTYLISGLEMEPLEVPVKYFVILEDVASNEVRSVLFNDNLREFLYLVKLSPATPPIEDKKRRKPTTPPTPVEDKKRRKTTTPVEDKKRRKPTTPIEDKKRRSTRLKKKYKTKKEKTPVQGKKKSKTKR